MVPPQHGHDAQTQAGGVAANQTGRLQQQLGFHQTQLIQELQEHQQQRPVTHQREGSAVNDGGGRMNKTKHLNGKVYEATDVERVLHEVEDELDVLDQGQVVGHP